MADQVGTLDLPLSAEMTYSTRQTVHLLSSVAE